MIVLFVKYQLVVHDPEIVRRRHLRVETIHQKYVVGVLDALHLPSLMHCFSQVGHVMRVLELLSLAQP
jgi:hypothetical protein